MSMTRALRVLSRLVVLDLHLPLALLGRAALHVEHKSSGVQQQRQAPAADVPVATTTATSGNVTAEEKANTDAQSEALDGLVSCPVTLSQNGTLKGTRAGQKIAGGDSG